MTEAPDDRSLVRLALIEGDEVAWRRLYQRHTPALYRLAGYLADSEADAGDLVQEMWLRAARGLSRFEQRSTLRTWLTGILINCVREWRRDSFRVAEVPLEDDLPSPAPDNVSGLDRIDLERAVARLAPGFRAVLLLHDVEGYTHQEIAGMLGVEPGTSKSQLTRARRAMLRTLASRQGVPHG